MPSTTAKSDAIGDVMIVLDHSGARIYRADSEDKPDHVLPEDPGGHSHQMHSSRGESGGKHAPSRKHFYDTIAKKLAGSERIHLIGDGKGSSSEMEQFVAELQHHHKDVAERIASTEVADISHMTEGDFAAKAKSFA